MIVTRSWLEEYIDLRDVDNTLLVSTLNAIGLEVDSIQEHKIHEKVVVGEIVSCVKHPDADKLNLCQVNTGSETVQIICGAANVVNAKYVAVATVGAVLPGNFKIKKAKLRGVESFGMICSSSELGLPELEDGIMILDESIGELIVGKPLNEYPRFADTVIDIELTANRGDCDSIYGIARDLAAAFKKELKHFDFEPKNRSVLGVARELQVESHCSAPCTLLYSIVEAEAFKSNFLQRLRLGFIKSEAKDNLERLLMYVLHESGVLLRAYDFAKLQKEAESVVKLDIMEQENSTIEVSCNGKLLSIVGVNQNSDYKADENSQKALLEASYIDPDFVVEGVSANGLESDALYYNSSRGSETQIEFGMKKLQQEISLLDEKAIFSSAEVPACESRKGRKISVRVSEINAIIGSEIPTAEMVNILMRLGFDIQKVDDDVFAVTIPPFRHDIKNSYDVAEEVLRIYGIDNIQALPLTLVEANRINETYLKFRALRDIRERAVAANFFEALTYAFANRELLQRYGFDLVDEKLDLLNPIVKELNTLRTTILVNLLEAAKRNVNYGKKRIGLFEVGTVFTKEREEYEVISFLLSGEEQRASVHNSAKAKMVDLESFVSKVGSVIGEFRLEPIEAKNGLMHPYISAAIIKDGESIGYLAKLHPKAAEEFSLKDTFIAEILLEKVLPKHINAHALSNFQAVTKDLSVLVKKSLPFYQVAKELQALKSAEVILKDFYPLDIYEDSSLGDKKSLTIRFTLQSDSATLSDSEIENVMSTILEKLKESFGAALR